MNVVIDKTEDQQKEEIEQKVCQAERERDRVRRLGWRPEDFARALFHEFRGHEDLTRQALSR